MEKKYQRCYIILFPSHEETTMTIQKKCENSLDNEEHSKKEKVRRFYSVGEKTRGRRRRRTEKDVRSREVSPYNRLFRFAYLCRASFACHLHHHLTSACSFCAPSHGTSSFFPFARDAPLRSVFA